MSSARILLVGGAGYIGSVCCRMLANNGHHVSTLDNLSTGHRAAVTGELHVADLLQRGQVHAVLQQTRPDVVIHLAARSIVGESVRKPLDYYNSNLIGTLHLLDAMRAVGCRRLVFSSTCAIFGNPIQLPIDEEHPRNPVNPYGHSKEMIERILEDCQRREGLNVMRLRYFNAAGATHDGQFGEAHHPETHLIPLALDARFGRRPPLSIFGTSLNTPDGTCVRDFIHVEDLANAHQKAVTQLLHGAPGEAYNLGTGQGTSVREVLNTIAEVTGGPVPTHDAPPRPGDAAILVASNVRAQNGLGWSPTHSFHEIIESAARWSQRPRYKTAGG